jgi:hypothetical protein
MKFIRVMLYLLATLVIFGCALTKLTSVKDPLAKGTGYDNLLVLARINDLNDRMTVEDIFAFQLQQLNIDSMPSARLFVPIQTYSERKINSMLADNKIDGVLIFTPADEKTDKGIPLFTKSKLNLRPRQWKKISHAPSSSPANLYFKISIYDVKGQRTVWLATSHTYEASRYLNNEGFFALVNSLADATIRKLEQDGMLGN